MRQMKDISKYKTQKKSLYPSVGYLSGIINFRKKIENIREFNFRESKVSKKFRETKNSEFFYGVSV